MPSCFLRSLPLTFVATALFWVACAAVAPAQQGELRSWKDKTGLHEIKASLVKVTADAVVLKRADGVEISVRLEQLSEADQQFAKKSLAAKPLPTTVAPGKAEASPFDQFVFASWSVDGQMRSVPGLAFETRGDMTRVVTLAPFTSRSMGVMPKEFTLNSNLYRGRKDTTGQLLSVHFFHKWVLSAAARDLPAPLPTKTPESLVEGTPVTVWGYSEKVIYQVESFARGKMAGKVSQLVRGTDRKTLHSIEIELPEPLQVQLGLVTNSAGEIVACIVPHIVPPHKRYEFREPTPKLIVAQPLEALRSIREPNVDYVSVVPIRGDLEEIEYEFVLRVADPLNTIGKPQLAVKSVEKERIDLLSNPSAEPLQDASQVALEKREPAAATLAHLDRRILDWPGEMYVARFKQPNPGPLESFRFEVQLVYTDGDQTQRMPVKFTSFSTRDPFNPSKVIFNIPGADGQGLDVPQPEKLADGSYRLTSERTAAQVEPSTRTKFPEPFSSDQEFGMKAKRVIGGEVVPLGWKCVRLGANPLPVPVSADGQYMYVVDQKGLLHKFNLATLTDEITLQLEWEPSQLALSQAGLVITFKQRPEMWVVDAKLQVKRELLLTNPTYIAATPTTSLGLVYGSRQSTPSQAGGYLLYLVDFASNEVLHTVQQHSPSDQRHREWLVDGQRAIDMQVYDFHMLANGTEIIVHGADNFTVLRISGKHLDWVGKPKLSPKQITLRFSWDRKLCANRSGEKRSVVTVYDPPNFQQPRVTVNTDANGIFAMASPDLFYFGSPDGTVNLIGADGQSRGTMPNVLPGMTTIVPLDANRFLARSEYGTALAIVKLAKP